MCMWLYPHKQHQKESCLCCDHIHPSNSEACCLTCCGFFFFCSNVQGDSQTSICITIEPGLLLKGDILVRNNAGNTAEGLFLCHRVNSWVWGQKCVTSERSKWMWTEFHYRMPMKTAAEMYSGCSDFYGLLVMSESCGFFRYNTWMCVL